MGSGQDTGYVAAGSEHANLSQRQLARGGQSELNGHGDEAQDEDIEDLPDRRL